MIEVVYVFNQTYENPKPAKLPTLKQWLKTTPKNKTTGYFHVDTIWVPGTFDNYTLQTGVFRLIITPGHPLYKELEDYLSDGEKRSTGISIQVTSVEDATFVVLASRHKGYYEAFYGNNWKWRSPSKDK